MNKLICAICLMATAFVCAQDTEKTTTWSGSRPDGHAPITVMGDHTHGKGEFMFSYRYMFMAMEDLKRGSNDEDFGDVLVSNGGDYMVTPTKMPMQMHMLGAMYAPSDKITVMLMANYTTMEMDHLTAMGGTFTTESSGFGDLKLGLLYKFFNKNRQQLHGQIGCSVPTGSIDQAGVTPASMGNEVVLPYPMQIGSGTFDAELALTYLAQNDVLSFGSQLKGVVRLGENSNDYSLGNRYNLNSWMAFKATKWLSFSARLEGLIVEEIDGANPNLNPMMVITADTRNSGGTYINSGLGFNMYCSKGALKNMRLGFELGMPLLQDVNGVQLKQKERMTLGLQYAF